MDHPARRPHRLARFPPWVSRWLGYRATPPPQLPQWIVWFWSFVGAFCGLSLVQAVFGQAHYFIARGVPTIVASYGASAVLVYGAIDAPLAQPRALVGGHFISALIGVCITKLFELIHSSERLAELRWLAGSLSASLAIVAMQITGTTHPPAGATALLAATNVEIYEMGWYYLPVILLSSTLILAVALLVNNIQRRYPVYWFKATISIPAQAEPALGGPEDPTPADLPQNGHQTQEAGSQPFQLRSETTPDSRASDAKEPMV